MSEPLGAEEELPRIRQGHSECDELCDAALLLREVDRLAEALEAAEDREGAVSRAGQHWKDIAERAEADLADEKGRRAGLRAGVEESLESLDLLCAAEDTHGDTIRAHEVRDAVSTLRALLDTATEETPGAP